MHKVHLLVLSVLLSSLSPAPAPLHDIEAARTAVWVSTEHSKAQCVSMAHRICDQVFGKCLKNDEAAVGGEPGYLVMYQCHGLRMSVAGSTTVLVIAGSRAEGTSSAKLTEWVTRSHDLTPSHEE